MLLLIAGLEIGHAIHRTLNSSRVGGDRSNIPGGHSGIAGAPCQSDNTAHRVNRGLRRYRKVQDTGHPCTPGPVAQTDIEGVSRRSDNNGHVCQDRSLVRSTELGSISHSGSGLLCQGERRVLLQRRW
jgi:hypothetical protein